jgi:hypothetical protein
MDIEWMKPFFLDVETPIDKETQFLSLFSQNDRGSITDCCVWYLTGKSCMDVTDRKRIKMQLESRWPTEKEFLLSALCLSSHQAWLEWISSMLCSTGISWPIVYGMALAHNQSLVVIAKGMFIHIHETNRTQPVKAILLDDNNQCRFCDSLSSEWLSYLCETRWKCPHPEKPLPVLSKCRVDDLKLVVAKLEQNESKDKEPKDKEPKDKEPKGKNKQQMYDWIYHKVVNEFRLN